jgi:hypothetical protein
MNCKYESIHSDPSLQAKINGALGDAAAARSLPLRQAGSVAWSMVKHAAKCRDDVDGAINIIQTIIFLDDPKENLDVLYMTAAAVLHALDSPPLSDSHVRIETMDNVLHCLIFPLLTEISTSRDKEKEVYDILTVTAEMILKRSQGLVDYLHWAEAMVVNSVSMAPKEGIDNKINWLRLSARLLEIGPNVLLLSDQDKMLEIYTKAVHILTNVDPVHPLACSARDLIQAILRSATHGERQCFKYAEVLYSICR